MKIFFRRIHLYLSLAAGLIIMVTCLTGAILVFQDELQHSFNKHRYYVTAGTNALPLHQLIGNVKQQLPTAKINGVKVYKNPSKTIEINYAEKPVIQKNDKGEARKNGGEGGDRKTAFVNPYTGEVLELYSFRNSFFYTVMSLHRWMLGGPIGKLVVGIATFIFLFILITGTILWFPKTKNILKQRLKIKWDGNWKRLNNDLHIVFGFYSFIFLFIFAFTGLAWSFEWFNKGIYTVTRSSMQAPKPPVVTADSLHKKISFDEVLHVAKNNIHDVEFYNISIPRDSSAPYNVSVLKENAVHESAGDTYYIHPYTAQIIGAGKWSDKNAGQQVRATFKPIHVASIYGTPSKILGLLVCLLGTSFPVTGVIMWLNRIKKRAGKI